MEGVSQLARGRDLAGPGTPHVRTLATSHMSFANLGMMFFIYYCSESLVLRRVRADTAQDVPLMNTSN